jgi:hypothetical protein
MVVDFLLLFLFANSIFIVVVGVGVVLWQESQDNRDIPQSTNSIPKPTNSDDSDNSSTDWEVEALDWDE